MSFKTAAEIFGDGGGFGPAVPYSTSNPPGTSAGNRGVQFGEQLTAAIANRTHFALALNDQDLNTRLASFEVGGLDAAYDLGTVGPAGSGRVVTKDAGAVETRSTLATMYTDDHANAHFRANAISDSIDGGGGFDFVGRSGVSLPTQSYGYIDRRDVILSGGGSTLPGGIIAATLNVGGSVVDSVTLGAGTFKDDGSNSDLMLKRDMVEILNGTNPGLYYVSLLSTTTRCTLKRLDGTVPSFVANESVNIRIFRPMFMTNAPNASTGLGFQGIVVTGMPGAGAAMEFIPGAVGGRFDQLLTGGAGYAFLVKSRFATGTTAAIMGVDGLGQIFSVATSALLTAAQLASGVGFGNPGYYSQIGGTQPYEAGVVVRIDDQINHHYGVVVSSESRGSAIFTGGTINFTFGSPGGRIVSGTVAATDWFVAPDATFIEILTPSAQAGIYRVSARGAGNGQLDLIDLGGAAVTGFPTTGTGTFRILHGVNLGDRTFGQEIAAHRAAASIEVPAQANSSGISFFVSSHDAQYAFRMFTTEDGVTAEYARLNSNGTYEAKSFGYVNPPTRYNNISLPAFHRDQLNSTVADFHIGAGTNNYWLIKSNGGDIYADLNPYLRDGMIITGIEVIMKPGAARSSTNRAYALVGYTPQSWVSAGSNPVAPVQVAFEYDDTTANKQIISITGLSHTVVRDSFNGSRDYWMILGAGNTAGTGGQEDTFWGVRIHYTDPGPRNN